MLTNRLCDWHVYMWIHASHHYLCVHMLTNRLCDWHVCIWVYAYVCMRYAIYVIIYVIMYIHALQHVILATVEDMLLVVARINYRILRIKLDAIDSSFSCRHAMVVQLMYCSKLQ